MTQHITADDMTPDPHYAVWHGGRFTIEQHSAVVTFWLDKHRVLLNGTQAFALADALFQAAGHADPAAFGEMLRKQIGIGLAGSGSDIEGESVADDSE